MLRRIIMWLLPVLLAVICLKPSPVLPPQDFLASQGVISVLRELEAEGQGAALAAQRGGLRASFRSTQSVFLYLKERVRNRSNGALWELASGITTLSYRYDFPPEFVLSMIQVESNYRNDAVSPKGAVGLLQLKESTAREIVERRDEPWRGRAALHDTGHNLDLALWYLHDLRKRFKSPHAYLSAYAHGPGIISQKIRDGEPLPREYYQRVMTNYRRVRIEGRQL